MESSEEQTCSGLLMEVPAQNVGSFHRMWAVFTGVGVGVKMVPQSTGLLMAAVLTWEGPLPVALAIADLLEGLQTVESSEEQTC